MLSQGTILGHYRILQRVGVGGMGEIYVAEDTRIARQVAIKIVSIDPQPYPDSAAVQEVSRLFQREMKAIAMLDHRNILSLIDFGEEIIDGQPIAYMVMPYRKEGSLNDWLQRYKTNGSLSLDEVDNILFQAADALQHAHDHQVIHQDVKPSNFLIREKANTLSHPDLLLTDFGVSKLTNATATASQHVRGTPAFMPPEQWESQAVPATDQYALAILVYLLLTGRTPFVGRMEQVMRQHLMIAPTQPSAYNTRLSPAIDAVILRALAKQPEARFPSIIDFAYAFHQAIQYGGDLRTTLRVNTPEAQTGTRHTISLPGGRRISITIPPNSYDGQELRVEGEGEPYYNGGPRGPVLVKLMVTPGNALREPIVSMVKTAEIGAPPPPPTFYEIPKQSSTIPPTVEDRDAYRQWPPPSSPKKRPTILIASILVILALLFALVIGAVHQSSVNNDNAHATATANTNQANAAATANTNHANATATANIENANATATATIINANPDPYDGGTLALYDPLTQSGNWSNGSNSSFGGLCQFESDGYHITESHNRSAFHCDTSTSFNNFVFEVKMTIIRGDCGGMLLRYNSSTGTGYEIFVCSDGSYQITRYSGFSGSDETTLGGGSNSGITSGQNTIAVVAKGSTFSLYLNNTSLGNSITDSTYSQGEVDMLSEDITNTTDVAYSAARLWTL